MANGQRFEGVFQDDFATRGTYTDEFGAQFTVEMKAKTHFFDVNKLGERAFLSKIPFEVVKCSAKVAFALVAVYSHEQNAVRNAHCA